MIPSPRRGVERGEAYLSLNHVPFMAHLDTAWVLQVDLECCFTVVAARDLRRHAKLGATDLKIPNDQMRAMAASKRVAGPPCGNVETRSEMPSTTTNAAKYLVCIQQYFVHSGTRGGQSTNRVEGRKELETTRAKWQQWKLA